MKVSLQGRNSKDFLLTCKTSQSKKKSLWTNLITIRLATTLKEPIKKEGIKINNTETVKPMKIKYKMKYKMI
jgi:hypothetical protein